MRGKTKGKIEGMSPLFLVKSTVQCKCSDSICMRYATSADVSSN